MSEKSTFEGFSKKTVEFYQDLKNNNNKKWFAKYKNDYEQHVKDISKAFVVSMGIRLKELSAGIVAVPQINRSLFKISRDTRFSSDKTPYKTNLGIFFWEGEGPRFECPGFYFHLEPPEFMLGGGFYMFPRPLLERYRNAVIHPEKGSELSSIVEKITKIQGFELGGKHYKRIPAGYDPDHANAELLLHNGLYIGQTTGIPEEFYSNQLVDYCFNKFKLMLPLHFWLVSLKKQKF